jgi:hypothetical protein
MCCLARPLAFAYEVTHASILTKFQPDAVFNITGTVAQFPSPSFLITYVCALFPGGAMF